MARMETDGLDKLINEMQRMGQDSGKVAEVMVDAAVAEIRDAWKESAEKAWPHKSGTKKALRDTGDMIDSIGSPDPAIHTGTGIYRDVYPQGKDSKGTRNAEKAFVLNYGTSRVEPTYWVDEAEAAAEPKIQERLEKIWGEFLETGKVPDIAEPGGMSGGITKTIK